MSAMSTFFRYLRSMPGIGSTWNRFMDWQFKMADKELRRLGLLYDDMLNEAIPVHARALEMLPEDMRMARQKRIKRALDIQLKKTYFRSDLQQQYDPWVPYLRERIKVVVKQEHDLRNTARDM